MDPMGSIVTRSFCPTLSNQQTSGVKLEALPVPSPPLLQHLNAWGPKKRSAVWETGMTIENSYCSTRNASSKWSCSIKKVLLYPEWWTLSLVLWSLILTFLKMQEHSWSLKMQEFQHRHRQMAKLPSQPSVRLSTKHAFQFLGFWNTRDHLGSCFSVEMSISEIQLRFLKSHLSWVCLNMQPE